MGTVEPQILDVAASEVQPFDVVDEGRFVRALDFADPWNFGSALDPDWATAVVIHASTLSLVDEPICGPDGPDLLRPLWGELGYTAYRPDAIVRVLRGMVPPKPPCRFDTDGDGNCVFHSDCATRRLRQP